MTGRAAIMAWMLCTAAAVVVPSVHAGSGQPDENQIRLIGVVPLNSAAVNQGVYRQVDRLVPALKKIPAERIIKLECRYVGSVAREQDVMKAFMVASKIEKYLREHHKLNIDLWVSARVGAPSRDHSPSLTFSVFSDDIRSLEKLPVLPAKAKSEQPSAPEGDR